MIKPTAKQLKLLYPNINTDYLSDYIDRQLVLVDIEKVNVNKVDVIMDAYLQRIVGIIAVNDVKNGMVKKTIHKWLLTLISELEIKLAELQIDSMFQMYETSSYLYKWILEKHFCQELYQIYAGEQKSNKTVQVTKKKLSKQKANDIVNNNPIGININNYLDLILKSVNKTYDNSNQMISNVKAAFNKAANKIKSDTSYLQQKLSYDAMGDVEFKADGYENVYYRIEVLDSDICLSCMSIDGSINKNPLGLLHRNCRGIDILLLKDSNGKYYDTNLSGYGNKLKKQSFDKKFAKLNQKQKRRMLGKTNYEYYINGQLSIDDFISYGRQITKKEADIKVALKVLKSKIQTPNMATRISNQLESTFVHKISEMDNKELLAYEKILGYERQLYEFVPELNYGKTSLQDYLSKIDAKYQQVQARREILKKGDV